jgi:hypothetical protein
MVESAWTRAANTVARERLRYDSERDETNIYHNDVDGVERLAWSRFENIVKENLFIIQYGPNLMLVECKHG